MELFRIKELLKEFDNFTMEDLSKKVGVSRTNLYNYLSRKNQTISLLEKISNELRVDISDLFNKKEQKKEIHGFLLMDNFIYYIKNEEDFKEVIDLFTDNSSKNNEIKL